MHVWLPNTEANVPSNVGAPCVALVAKMHGMHGPNSTHKSTLGILADRTGVCFWLNPPGDWIGLMLGCSSLVIGCSSLVVYGGVDSAVAEPVFVLAVAA